MMSSVDPDRGTVSTDETAAAPSESVPRHHAVLRFTPGTLLLGRYRMVSPLGKGGMGEVYRADDIRLGQPVALKFLPAALAAEAGRLERLVDEVRIGRQISHPNVCRLYDIAEAEGHHFLVMEYVDGEDLASLLRRIGRLPGDTALEIARGMCAGLAAAHDKGVIHRDLKPANVMIDGRGHARIADFGLAALAEQGPASGLAGTPAYMAPEQLSGEGASLQSDVFALGLVLSEMLTGQRVFEPTTLEQLKALHAQWKPPSLSSGLKDVDPALERVVQRCLARDPKDRPASARGVLAALPGGDPLQAALLAGETPSPDMVAAASKVGDLPPSLAWAGLLAGLVGLALVATLAGRVMLHDAVPPLKPPEALRERAKQVLARVGETEAAADGAHGFELDRAAVEYVKGERAGQGWWELLRTSRPGAYRFWYRQSPASLWSRSWLLTIPFISPAELGRVTRFDPPLNVPGMSAVQLDMEGRLISLAIVPVAAGGAGTRRRAGLVDRTRGSRARPADAAQHGVALDGSGRHRPEGGVGRFQPGPTLGAPSRRSRCLRGPPGLFRSARAVGPARGRSRGRAPASIHSRRRLRHLDPGAHRDRRAVSAQLTTGARRSARRVPAGLVRLLRDRPGERLPSRSHHGARSPSITC
jgi:serine/threonine-protein kinase